MAQQALGVGDLIEARRQLLFDWRSPIYLTAIAFVLLVLRQPDKLLNAQFWAEDGIIFYANAYNLGALKSIFIPYAGYLNTAPALVASFSQLFPLQWSPLVFNLVALVFQSLPVLLITSSRFATLIPSFAVRLLIAFLYVGVTNSPEVHATVTNIQWYLSLMSSLIIIAQPSPAIAWQIFDVCIVVLTALTGPFAIFLLPIAVLKWRFRREKWLLPIIAILTSGAVIQVAVLAFAAQSRPKSPLEATPVLFAKILAGQVFLGGLIGNGGLARVASESTSYNLLAVIVAIAGIAAIVYVLWQAPLELRLFALFSFLLLAASLALAGLSWNILWRPGSATRYWFFPILAWSASLVWLLTQKDILWLRKTAAVLLVIMGIGIAIDWYHPPLPNLDFQKYAREFEELPSGKPLAIPINPPGWSMSLTKH